MAGPIETATLLSGITPEMIEALTNPMRPPRPVFDPPAFAALTDRTFHELRRHILHRYRPGSAPPCRRIELMVEHGSAAIELGVRIVDGYELRLSLRAGVDVRDLMHVGFARICELYWDGEAEAFNRDFIQPFDWRYHVELRNRINDARRGLSPRPTADEGYRELGLDLATGGDATFTIVTQSRRVGRTLEMEQRAVRDMTATEMSIMERESRDRIRRDMMDAMQAMPTYDCGIAFPTEWRAAEARGLQLLKEWLSPEQLAQFERDRAFDVTGSVSGKRYRIKLGRQQNVFELDAEGREICGWCFAPEGELVPGDVMLAQKVALETDERGALKVANPFGGGAHRYFAAPGNRGWFRELFEGRWT